MGRTIAMVVTGEGEAQRRVAPPGQVLGGRVWRVSVSKTRSRRLRRCLGSSDGGSRRHDWKFPGIERKTPPQIALCRLFATHPMAESAERVLRSDRF